VKTSSDRGSSGDSAAKVLWRTGSRPGSHGTDD
jgi:hypothetical protein